MSRFAVIGLAAFTLPVAPAQALAQEAFLWEHRAPEDEQDRHGEQHEAPERGRQQGQPQVEHEQPEVEGVAREAVRAVDDHCLRRLPR